MTISRGLPVVNNCWNDIGVHGDRSCSELASAIHCRNCCVFAAAAQTLLDRPAPDDYESELSTFVAEPLSTRHAADRSAVLFGVGGESFAIETQAVIEVGDASPPRRVPHRSNDVFAGLSHIKGRLELCVSLAGVLGLERPRPQGPGNVRVLVASAAGQRLVFPVDTVAGIARFHESHVVEAPASSRRSSAYVLGLLPNDGALHALLDVSRICERVKERLR